MYIFMKVIIMSERALDARQPFRNVNSSMRDIASPIFILPKTSNTRVVDRELCNFYEYFI